MDNKPKSERIHELLPALLGTKQDQNWSALIGAIGAEDDRLAALIESVRDQFFVKTASRPYLDRLAANNNISRPKLVGINDADFRNYIPVLAYQPKQVKHIIDTLLDLFFAKETTTAFITSSVAEPVILQDGWGLQLKVDDLYLEQIKFVSADFSNIAAVTMDEIVAAYNRQAKYSYATVFFDSITKQKLIRIFTNTIGAQGSLENLGGLANIALQFNGFLFDVGSGTDTDWVILKTSDVVSFVNGSGDSPNLDKLLAGDIFLCSVSGNEGSFVVTEVDAENRSFSFINLFATEAEFTQISNTQCRFLRPEKITPYKVDRRALTWETKSGQVTVETPTTPTVVRRALRGGFHLNGSMSEVESVNSDTVLTIKDVSRFPSSGQFVIQPRYGIPTRLSDIETATLTSNGRLISKPVRYSYSEIIGNSLVGISPTLPPLAADNDLTIGSMSRTSNVVTCNITGHGFAVGEMVNIRGGSGITAQTTSASRTINSPILTVADSSGIAPGQLISGTGIPADTQVLSISGTTVVMTKGALSTGSSSTTFSENTNGTFEIASTTTNSFTFNKLGLNGTASTPGMARVERMALVESGSKVILTTARPKTDTKMAGSYVWDRQAPFVLSSHVTTSTNAILAGKTVKLLDVGVNTLSETGGLLIFDYGTDSEEGPVRYVYKANDTSLVMDPSYIFKKNHDAGCPVVMLNHTGAHTMSGNGRELPPYVTNPTSARLALQDLIKSVSTAGVFIDFLVRYPTQLYAAISVYDQQ